MARLPQPGGDEGDWGNVLNTFLTTAHNTDGTLKGGSVTSAALGAGAISTAHLQNGSVTAAKLSAPTPANGQVLGYTGGALAWTTPSAGASTPVATGSATGTITLAGDLGGTAAAPTVPGLATKANTTDVVNIASSQSVTGSKNFTGGLQTNGQAVVATNDARLTDQRTPSDASVTMNKLSAGAGSNDQILSVNGGDLVWVTATATGTISDATSSVKGIITLSGDLGGTAGSPTVPGLAAKAADNAVVHLTGAETVAGVKTFSSSPIIPTPTTGTQAATKAYVDTAAAGAGAVTSVAGKTGVVALVKADVGLGSVDNTTDAAKPISTATQTALTGKAATVHVHAAADITSGTIASTRLGSGTANSTTYLRGDGQWATPAGGGGGNGYSFTIRHISADATAVAYDMIFIDSVSAGAVTVTLPAPTANATVRVKRLAANGNGAQVAAPGGSYIDAATGVGTHTLNNLFDSQDFWSDGSNWFRV